MGPGTKKNHIQIHPEADAQDFAAPLRAKETGNLSIDSDTYRKDWINVYPCVPRRTL